MGPVSNRDETACSSAASAQRPLVVSAEALVRNQRLLELLAAYVKLGPLHLFKAVAWLWRGRAYARRRLAGSLPAGLAIWPVNAALAGFARGEAGNGRAVYLATTLAEPSSEELKAQFPYAAGVILVPGDAPPASRAQALGDHLARLFPQGFDYAGGSETDVDVWRRAAGAVLVDAARRLERSVAAVVPVAARIQAPSASKGLLEGVRLHQWVKNLLVFAPIVLGGRVDEMEALLPTMAAFLALGLVASSAYLINDILDVADDRRHWSKRERPIARGDLPASTALIWAIMGLAAGLAVAGGVSRLALGVVLIYVAMTFAYSLYLKRLPLVDGLVLATQYTLRLALGVAAAQVPPSPWLFVFSMFLFTSLCLAKRYTELMRSRATHGTSIAGRGYRPEDAPLVLAVGIAAGLSAVIIIILYIIDDAFRQSFYRWTVWLWGFPPLVFLLICRMWLVTTRGEMHDDPVRFMLTDRVSQGLLAVLVTCFAFAWLG